VSEGRASSEAEPSAGSLIQEATHAARAVERDLLRLSSSLAGARSELQEANRQWRTRTVEGAERRGWARAHGSRVALLPTSEEHVRVNKLLDAQGIHTLYRRATSEPRALAASLELHRLRVDVHSGVLRIRDLTTAEICLEWKPPRSTARPSTDPSTHVEVQDSLTLKLLGGGHEGAPYDAFRR